MDAPTWTGSRSPVSRLLLLWFSPLLKLGYQRPLQQDDCAPLEPHLQAASVYPALAKAWQQRLEDATYSDQGATIVEKLHSGTEAWLLAGTLLRLHWRRVAPAVSLQLLGSALAFSGPLLLHQLVVFMQAEGRQSAEEVTQAYGMVVLMCLLPAVAALCTAHGWCRLIAVQASVRAQLTCTLFRKAMQLSNRSRQQMELGKIVNLMSADATTVTNFFNGPCTLLIVSPLTIVTALVLLWFQISWAALIGLGVLSLSTPTAHQLVRRLSRVRKQMLVHTDERIKKMNQLLAGIRVLKLYAWEAAQEAAVLVARREELGQLRQAIRFRLGMNLLHFTSPIIAAVCSFGVYGAVAGDQFTAPRIFAAIALFSLIRAPLTRLPFSLVQATNAWVSLKRLSQFFVLEERDSYTRELGRVGIHIQDGTFCWGQPDGSSEAASRAGHRGSRTQADKASASSGHGLRTSTGPEQASGHDHRTSAGPKQASGHDHRTSAGPKQGSPGAQGASRTAEPVGRPGETELALQAGSRALYDSAESVHSAAASRTAGTAHRHSSPDGHTSRDSKSSSSSDRARDHSDSSGGVSRARRYNSSDQHGSPLYSSPHVRHGSSFSAAQADTPGSQAEPQDSGLDPTAPGWWLRNINVTVEPGQLVCIVGRVASGKSSLLSALLGDMELHGGCVQRGGSVAYVGQQAWIAHESLQDNILFGRPFVQRAWEQCVHACCLDSDLKMLPGGAATEIGEKGINLSGGQKQRVSLARAVYQDADLYLMDDPLSAVDVHVGKHIFDHCIMGALRHKTRVLVTNQLQYLAAADQVVFLQDGGVLAQGPPAELAQHPAMVELMHSSPAAAYAQHSSSACAEHSIAAQHPAMVELMHSSPAAAAVPGLGREGAGQPTQDSSAASASGSEQVAPTQAGAGYGNSTDGGDSSRAGEQAGMQDVSRSRGNSGGVHEPVQSSERGAYLAQQDLNKMEVAITLTEERPHQSSGHEAVPEGSATGHADDSSDKGGNDSDPDEGRPLLERATLSSAAGTTAGTAGRNGSVPRGAGAGGGKAGGLMTKEDREVGQVRLHVYQRYFGRAYGLPSLVTILLLWSGEQSLRLLTNWWLARWTGAETDHHRLKAQGIPAPSPRNHFIAGYFCFAMVLVVCTAIRLAVNLLAAWRAARRIHQETLHAVTRAPVSFFDTTPTGRILNRFARDLDDMDYMLPQSITQLGNCLVQLAASFTFVCILQPAFLLGLLPLLTLYYFLQRFYRRSSVELLRLEAVSRSPMYAGFSESLSGVETIRAYGRVEHFAARHDSQVNANNRAYWGLRMAEQWLSMRLDLIGATLVLLAAGLAVAARNRVAAVLLALGLAEVLDATQFLKQAVQAAANFEGRLASVERLLAYQEVPQEAPRSIEGRQPPPDWPLLGALSYQGVWMRYRPTLEPVLKAVSFSVAGGEKIGIVGRTGCGKSSLILTLFRIVEPYAGTVTLDGLNLLSLGLDDVRGRLAAIPQDPLLFSGSVRSNLDPYSRYTDSELWAALGQVALKEVVAAHPQGLSATVAEGGDNWSVGQRQLLCVARALLRRPVLLVLDEATASVDGQTDALIQRTLRANFQRSTVLTIAHRLNTIMDSDKVLVLEAGRVVEFDTVARLQQDMASAFHGMISQAYTH